MFYNSRRSLKGFFKTRNFKYYAAFFMLLAATITSVIIISKKKPADSSNDSITTDVADNEIVEDPTTELSSKGVYRITINLANNQIAFFPQDDNGSYNSIASKYMIAGISEIEEGSYKVDDVFKAKNSWIASDINFYRYYTSFNDTIIFHSALYSKQNDKNSLIVSDYESIGKNTTSQGITLQLADAKWIYENCSFECIIDVISDENEAVNNTALEKIHIPTGITWDPSDDATGSPWCPTKISRIVTNENMYVYVGTDLKSLKSYAKAFDSDDNDISKYIYITPIDISKKGTYTIEFNLLDIYGNQLTKKVNLVVSEKEKETESETESESETKTKKETETHIETESETPTEIVTQTENITETEVQTETETETEETTEPETESESESESESVEQTEGETTPFETAEEVPSETEQDNSDTE